MLDGAVRMAGPWRSRLIRFARIDHREVLYQDIADGIQRMDALEVAGATGFEPVAFGFGVKAGGGLPSGHYPKFSS